MNLENILISEIKISYNSTIPKDKRTRIQQSSDAYALLISTWNGDTLELQEAFKILLLNRANEAIGIYTCSIGSSSSTIVDVKLIFAVALKANAQSIILAHNHPSGNLKPSEADNILTQKMKEAGKLLDIPVLDHIIVTKEGYYSFSDEG